MLLLRWLLFYVRFISDKKDTAEKAVVAIRCTLQTKKTAKKRSGVTIL